MSATAAPPQEVLTEFLGALHGTLVDLEENQTLVPVLRGSLLLRHWFGESARPAGDLDLECFVPSAEPPYGYDGEFETRLELCKAMCRYAAESTAYYPSRATRSEIEFLPIEALQAAEAAAMEAVNWSRRPPPLPGGSSLWTYGTPGERYFTGWRWQSRRRDGQLQIDIAESRSYGIDEIDVAPVQLKSLAGATFEFVGYTREMLLAAKLSWLLRSFRTAPAKGSPEWTGEPKDLFDAHLLLTGAHLDAKPFQKSLTAIGIEDDLDWSHLETLLAAGRAGLPDSAFPNWDAFHKRHKQIIRSGPGEMLAAIIERLPPLLGAFHRPDDAAFLAAIAADPVDEFAYKLYADKLEERGDAAAPFLRLFSQAYFHKNELSAEQRAETNRELKAALVETSKPWLLRLFGTSARYREMTGRISAGKM